MIKVTVTDAGGARTVIAELPTDVIMFYLVPTLVQKMSLPRSVIYGIMHKESGRLLKEDESLASVSAESGDTLRLLPNVTAGAGFPVRSFRDIQLIEGILTQNDLIHFFQTSVIFAVFLYTEEDKDISSYLRENVEELHYMSGNQCVFFTVEKPAPEWQKEIRQTLGKLAGDYSDMMWRRLGTGSYTPFDKKQAYNIGHRLGVKPAQFPCIVFFSELRSRKVSIVEINKFVKTTSETAQTDYTKFFRLLFSVAQEVTQKPRNERLTSLEKSLAKEWHTATKKQVKAVESVELTTSIIEVIGAIVKAFF